MVTVHAAYIKAGSRSRWSNGLGTWASVCGSQDGPISDDSRRVNCEECKRIASERGIVL